MSTANMADCCVASVFLHINVRHVHI